jgi:hypothetical protein
MPVSVEGTAAWPEANSASYGPVKAFSTPPDRVIEGRLPYRRVAARTDDPLTRNKPRVIIPHNGFSFAAPPQAR